MSPPATVDVSRRGDVLRRYQLLSRPRDEALDDVAQLAGEICEAPFAVVGLHDEHRVVHQGRFGLEAAEVPRAENSFCAAAMHEGRLLVVEDARADPRFRDFFLVANPPYVRSYAGVPLVLPEGVAVGTLCVVDTKPRGFSVLQRHALETLARQVVLQMVVHCRQVEDANLQKDLLLQATTDKAVHDRISHTEALNEVAHQIMTPLTPLLIQVHLLRRNATLEQDAAFEVLERNLLRLAENVRHVLDVPEATVSPSRRG